MIKVKDPKRLKAFGFKEVFNNYIKNVVYQHPDNHVDPRLWIDLHVDGKTSKLKMSVHWDYHDCGYEYIPLDDIFDLQAAGLLERVNGDEKRD